MRLPGAPPALGGLAQWQRATAAELFSAQLPFSDTHCPPEGRVSLAVYGNLTAVLSRPARPGCWVPERADAFLTFSLPVSERGTQLRLTIKA